MRRLICCPVIGIVAVWCACVTARTATVRHSSGRRRQADFQRDGLHVLAPNGSGKKPDGSPYDLSVPAELAEFWGRLGDMQPHATRRSVTDCDGRFSIEVPDRSYGLLAMDAERRRGSLVLIPYPYDGEKVQMQLAPLVKVHGRMESVVGHRTIDWSHVFVELAPDPQQPLARRRIVSCGSFERRFEFRLPPGDYLLDAYAISDLRSETIDLRAQSGLDLTIDGTTMDVDLGVLKLTSAPPGLDDLRTEAMQQGRWNDYTKHYGKPTPTWHALDARGIGRDATVKDFRGKWLLIDFWGLSCVPCLATGIPGMMDFYEEYAAQRNQFEIVQRLHRLHR